MSRANLATQVIVWTGSLLPRLSCESLLERQPGLVVHGSAANLDDIQALPQTKSPTTILVDMPQPLPASIMELANHLPGYGLLCLVDAYDLTQVVTLLQAGIIGVMSRNATLPELTRGLIAAARGEIVLPPSLAARALTALARGEVKAHRQLDFLTEREREVLSLLAEGKTNKDIAQLLFLSVRTIEAHLRNIYGKLDVNSRTEAVLWAVQHGVAA